MVNIEVSTVVVNGRRSAARKRARRVAWAALALLPALAFQSPAAHAAVLPSCTVQLSDLRPGYMLSGSGYSITDLAALQYHVSQTAYNADAALVSYSSSYYLPRTPTYREVEGSISLFASSTRAHDAFRQNVSSIARWHRTWKFSDQTGRHQVDERWRAVGGGALGQESGGWVTETRDAQHAYSVAFLFFRRGLYLAGVRIFGPVNTVNILQAVPLGRLVDRRVQSVCALK